jgi:hypothetical protein
MVLLVLPPSYRLVKRAAPTRGIIRRRQNHDAIAAAAHEGFVAPSLTKSYGLQRSLSADAFPADADSPLVPPSSQSSSLRSAFARTTLFNYYYYPVDFSVSLQSIASSASIAARARHTPSLPSLPTTILAPCRQSLIIQKHPYSCIRPFSTSSFDASTSQQQKQQQLSLKKAIRPFLRACHPDASSFVASSTNNNSGDNRTNASSHHAKEVNLRAVQTMNGLVDSLDILIGRCTPPSYYNYDNYNNNIKSSTTTIGPLPELKSRYEIEFILPPTNVNKDDERKGRKRKKNIDDKVALTLRSITITFPEYLRSNVKRWALTSFHYRRDDDGVILAEPPTPQEEEAYRTAMQLREHALLEFGRLLSIAGMKMPADSSGPTTSSESSWGSRRKEENQWTLTDHFLHELGIDPMEEVAPGVVNSSSPLSGAYFGRTQSRPTPPKQSSPSQPPTYSHPQLQQQRTAFINSIPWNRFALDYENAYNDAQADWITNRLNLYNVNTLEGRERREQMVSSICGRARIVTCHHGDEISGEKEKVNEDIPEGLDVIAQLVAIRRLSLLLYDNFDHLQMERMGRMWERLVIVFTPPRTNRRRRESRSIGSSHGTNALSLSSSPVHRVREDGTPMRRNPGRKLTKWERRKRHREKMMPVSRGWMRHIANNLLGNKKMIQGGGSGGEHAVEGFDKATDDGSSSTTTNNTNSASSPSSLPYMSESGFKFSYGTTSDQSVGHVTAYIPIDFRDGELVRQLYTHVYDYFDNCCGHVGFLKYGADGDIRANFEGRRGVAVGGATVG